MASYPFDDNENFKTFTTHSYSKSPDDDFFKFLAQTYANNHAFMFKMDGKACGDNEPTFHKGINELRLNPFTVRGFVCPVKMTFQVLPMALTGIKYPVVWKIIIIFMEIVLKLQSS